MGFPILSSLALASAWGGTVPLDVRDELQLPIVDDPQALTEEGMDAISEGHSLRAAHLFTAGLAKHTAEAGMLNNFAVALATLGMQRGSIPFLCESRAAAQLASQQGHAGATELLEAVSEHMAEPESCPGEDLYQAAAAAGASAAVHLEQVQAHCSDSSAVELRPTAREREVGVWSCLQLRRAWALSQLCGLTVLQGILDSKLLESVREARDSAEAATLAQGHTKGPEPYEEAEAASRGRLRHEAQLPLRDPYTAEGLIAAPLLVTLVRLLLGSRVELDTFSCIESHPGSGDQKWHVDVPGPSAARFGGGQLFRSPPMGLVAVVPLVPLTVENGATEFLAGSHVDMADARFWFGEEAGDGATKLAPRFQVVAEEGSLVLFDMRLMHRGRANAADASRPILYMSYVQEWFRDGINFKDRQSASWDLLPAAARRLLARLDARAYVRRLEEALESQGVNVSELRSNASAYKRSSLEL